MIRQVFGMLYCHRQIEIDRERNKTFVNERQEHFSHEGLITALHFIYSFLRFDKNHKSHTSLHRINCQSKTSKLRWLSKSAVFGTFDTVFTTPDCFVIDILFFKLYKLFKNKRFCITVTQLVYHFVDSKINLHPLYCYFKFSACLIFQLSSNKTVLTLVLITPTS